MHHDLKVTQWFTPHIRSGDKRFEIRLNDRAFQKGDTVSFCHEDADHLMKFGKPEGLFEITFVTSFEQKPDYVVFGFKECDTKGPSRETEK